MGADIDPLPVPLGAGGEEVKNSHMMPSHLVSRSGTVVGVLMNLDSRHLQVIETLFLISTSVIGGCFSIKMPSIFQRFLGNLAVKEVHMDIEILKY